MEWNWQQKDWPNFSFESAKLEGFERKFLQNSGFLHGVYQHIQSDTKSTLAIDIMSDEAFKTSEIEGEYLNRDSLQSSIRKNLGLLTDNPKIPPAEQGIAEMVVDVYHTFAEPLTHEMLYRWHRMLTKGRNDLLDVGCYRTGNEPMQVISGPLYKPKVHFEAPPSKQLFEEMSKFVTWFQNEANSLPAITRAGIAHLYFVCIHPFEDGNGRIGRAIAEKALAQSIGYPTLIALSHTIQKHKKAYYDALEQNNKHNQITPWLLYFAGTVLEAQDRTQHMINFLIEKTKLYDKVRSQLNTRQGKLLDRLFLEGPEGFQGGLSIKNYIAITNAPRATATRDLQDLVAMGVLTRTGELKSTRYWLNIAK